MKTTLSVLPDIPRLRTSWTGSEGCNVNFQLILDFSYIKSGSDGSVEGLAQEPDILLCSNLLFKRQPP